MKLFGFLFMGAVLILSFQNCSNVDFTASQNSAVVAQEVVDLPNPPPPPCVDLTADDVQPVVKWDWQTELASTPEAERAAIFDQVMSSPVVGDLDGDGIPEVVVSMFAKTAGGFFAEQRLRANGNQVAIHARNGALRVIDGATGKTNFSVYGDSASGDNKNIAPKGDSTPLLVDLDGNGSLEIVYPHYLLTSVIALNSDGSTRWIYPIGRQIGACLSGFSAVQIAGGGTEFLVGNQVIGEDAGGLPVVKQTIAGMSAASCRAFALSLDPGKPNEVQFVGVNGVFSNSGDLLFGLSSEFTSAANVRDDIVGVEVVTVAAGIVSMYNGVTGESIFSTNLNLNSALKCPTQATVGGGPATIGNFDEDSSTIEIATATGRYLTIFNDKGELIDQFETQDCSSQKTGITSFDFNGDGKPEILYADEEYMRVFEIRNGELTQVFREVNPSGTLVEYPVVVDVNGDGSAEIVMVSNNYGAARADWYADPGEGEADRALALATTGVRVFAPKTENAWMPTRSSWHQFWFSEAMLDDSGNVLESTKLDGSVRSFNRNSQLGLFEPQCVPQTGN